MERLTKTELRALLESIKECYPICDRQTFKQRVLSRLSKIVPAEIISHKGIHTRRRRNAHATHPHHAYRSSRTVFRQRARVSSLDASIKAAGLREQCPKKINPQSAAPCSLSPREAQVLQWVSQGKTNKEIGVILEVSPRTVQKHLEHIYQKMGVESRTGAAAKAYETASMASNRKGMFLSVVISSLIT
jgi:DNA-binding CsgD family transcriptional regulator